MLILSDSVLVCLFRRGSDYSVAFSETSFKWFTRGVLLPRRPLHCTSIYSALWAWSSVYGDGLQHSLCTPFKALLMCSKACGLLDTTPVCTVEELWRVHITNANETDYPSFSSPSPPLSVSLSLSLTHKHIHTYCLRFISPCQPFGATESSAGREKERKREGERAYITALGNAEDTLGAQQSEENSDLNGYKLISDRAVEGCRAAPVLKVSRMVQHSIL